MNLPKLASVVGLTAFLVASPTQPPAPPTGLIGITVPSQVAQVAPEQAGKIVEMKVHDGDRVAADEVLFRLNSVLEQLEVERLQALADSDLVVRRAELALQHAERQAARARNLRQRDIASERDLQKFEYEQAMARLVLEQAKLERNQATNQLAQARERLAQRSVRSPFAGTVTWRFKNSGDAVERFAPVVELMCLDPLWIEFECPVHQQHLFRQGTRVRVTPSRRPDDTRVATVFYMSPKANTSSHSFMIRAAVSNQDRPWRSGLKVIVELDDQTLPSKPGK